MTPPPTSGRSPCGSPATRTGTWPSPPAPPAPTSWTSTTTARPATGTPRSAGSKTPGCWTARPPTSVPAFRRLKDAGLLDGATAYVRTPSGGLHAYFTGSRQRNGHLAGHHLDFRSAGGYVLTPPSRVDGHPYQLIGETGGRGGLDWAAVTRLLQPEPHPQRPRQSQTATRDLSGLARWVAGQPEGNRNAGLFWAANRALETDPAADLSQLADAARQAGLGEREITRTLDSARKGGRTHIPDYQPEAGDQA